MTGQPNELEALQDILGYRFARPELLRQALIHSSSTSDRLDSNERLEFLGDRVLGLHVATMLYAKFPNEEEGPLGYRFSALVRRESLARVARSIGLGAFIALSPGEREAGGANKDGLLSDTCEAIIAAIYLDGGFDAAQPLIERYWTPLLDEDLSPPKDPKTALQEWAQARGHGLPEYETMGSEGPDHAPVFTVRVRVGIVGGPEQSASGASKRAAEQAAAAALLKDLEDD
mgnify:CR=1 FL=1